MTTTVWSSVPKKTPAPISPSSQAGERRVEIVRRYDKIAGVRVPISIESVAHVLIAGRSTFAMTYDYETVNGQRVGNPSPKGGPSAPSI